MAEDTGIFPLLILSVRSQFYNSTVTRVAFFVCSAVAAALNYENLTFGKLFFIYHYFVEEKVYSFQYLYSFQCLSLAFCFTVAAEVALELTDKPQPP